MWNGKQVTAAQLPLWRDVDTEGGFLFAAYSTGFKVWDARGEKAARPKELSVIDAWVSARQPVKSDDFPRFVAGVTEKDEFMQAIDVADGDPNLVALGGDKPAGASLWDVSDKTSKPVLLYQDGADLDGQGGDDDTRGKSIADVHLAEIGNRTYLFAGGSDAGLFLYDATRAKELAQSIPRCNENTSEPEINCPGVFLGQIVEGSSSYLDGIEFGGRYYVGSASLRGQLKIFDVTVPTLPIEVADFSERSEQPRGFAFWQDGDEVYLGVRALSKGRVFRVTSCLTSGCTQAPQPLSEIHLGRNVTAKSFATFSRAGDGTPFLYFGDQDGTAGPAQQEALVDVSDPANPRDVFPQQTATFVGFEDEEATVSYATWYYSENSTGFVQFTPIAGVFNGNHFYRVARTLFDVHEWTQIGGKPPVAAFTWSPQEIYPGTPVDFMDETQGRDLTWSWTFESGTPATSSFQNPTGVKFFSGTSTLPPLPTSVEVSLLATNDEGADEALETLTVLDPVPVVPQVVADKTTALVCEPVTFTAKDATGRPPVSFAWRVLDAQGSPVHGPTAAGESFMWTSSPSLFPGDYQGEVTATNADGSSGPVLSAPVTVEALGPLAIGSPPFTTVITNGTVKFTASAQNATEFDWDFGDGTGGSGKTVTHTYDQVGTYDVTLTVDNCVEEPRQESLEVVIDQIEPLVAFFDAIGVSGGSGSCSSAICTLDVGSSVTFSDFSSGAEAYDYAWTNTVQNDAASCAFTDTGHTVPVTQHTYTSTGTFYPCLRVRRGSEADVFVLAKAIFVSQVEQVAPPSISVSGPSRGEVGQALSYSASKSNCGNGTWSWSASSGGQVSASGSSAVVTFSTEGSKTVRATNSACSGTSGTRNVTITAPDVEGPSETGLVPSFTVSPETPAAGVQVTFDAGSSEGAPELYLWVLGDGTKGSGETIQHTYSQPGTYEVTLEIGKTLANAGCSLNFCTASVTQTIVVVDSCPPGKLCLLDGRFEVGVTFFEGNVEKLANPIRVSDEAGVFWFFKKTNFEVVSKMIDGRAVNGKFWSFDAALTDLPYTIQITDSETGEVWDRSFPGGSIEGHSSIEAFPLEDSGAGESTTGSLELLALDAAPARVGLGGVTAPMSGTCEPGKRVLCLMDGRFAVEVDFVDNRNGSSGPAGTIVGSDESGFFWFFKDGTIDLMVKMVDATAPPFEKWWVFVGSMTDTQYEIRITDTTRPELPPWTHDNAQGSLFGRADTNAFDP